MRKLLSVLIAAASIGFWTWAQAPAGSLVVSASQGSGLTGGTTTGLYLVDPVTMSVTAIGGTSAVTAGVVAGVPTAGNGANAVAIDPSNGHLIVGTIASAAGMPYGIREITLGANGTSVLSDVAIATRTSPGTTSGVQALAILPNGDILAIESTLGAPLGTIGLFQYARATGLSTPWNMAGAPALAANALCFDPGAFSGAGAAIVGFNGTGPTSNTIVAVPFGGGTVTSIAAYDNATLAPGGAGIPTGICLDSNGDLLVSHNDAIVGTTRVNRATRIPAAVAPSAFGSGQNAIALDAITGDVITVANATAATATTARQIRRVFDVVQTTGTVINQIPGGNTNGVAHASGHSVDGRGCHSGGGRTLQVRASGPPFLGNGGFGIGCVDGTPNGTGIIALGTSRSFTDFTGAGYPGCAVYNNFDLLFLPGTFDAGGNLVLSVPLPVGPFAGIKAFIQFGDLSTFPPLVISAPMEITLLPPVPACAPPPLFPAQATPVVWTIGNTVFTWNVTPANPSGPFTLSQGGSTIHTGSLTVDTTSIGPYSVTVSGTIVEGSQFLNFSQTGTIMDPPTGSLLHMTGTYQGLPFSFDYNLFSRRTTNISFDPGIPSAAAAFNLAPYRPFASQALTTLVPVTGVLAQARANLCAAAPICGFWKCVAKCAIAGAASACCIDPATALGWCPLALPALTVYLAECF